MVTSGKVTLAGMVLTYCFGIATGALFWYGIEGFAAVWGYVGPVVGSVVTYYVLKNGDTMRNKLKAVFK